MLTQAFATTKDAAPAAVSTGDGYAVFQVADVKAPHAPSFDEYKAHLVADYRDQQIPQMLAAQVKKLGDLAKQLNDLHKAAAQMNIPVKSSDLVGKDGQVPDVGAMTGPAEVAFSLPKGGISGPLNTGQAGIILAVTDKQEPTTDDMAKNFTQTRNQMLNQKREEVFDIYVGTPDQAGKYEEGRERSAMKAKPRNPGPPRPTPPAANFRWKGGASAPPIRSIKWLGLLARVPFNPNLTRLSSSTPGPPSRRAIHLFQSRGYSRCAIEDCTTPCVLVSSKSWSDIRWGSDRSIPGTHSYSLLSFGCTFSALGQAEESAFALVLEELDLATRRHRVRAR